LFEHKNGYPKYIIEKTNNTIDDRLLGGKNKKKHILFQLPSKGVPGEKTNPFTQ